MNKLKIGLDIDDTLLDFWGAYLKRFGKPKSDAEITYNVYQKLRTDKDFWVNLELINRPDFKPDLFCTKRVNPKSWTKESLIKNRLYPDSRNGEIENIPIYQLYYQLGQKSKLIKGRVDVFVDDSLKNFIEMNLNGVPCLLMDNEGNHSWGPIGRIYSLDYEEIEDTYYLFKNTIGERLFIIMYRLLIDNTNHAYAINMEDIEAYEYIQDRLEEIVYKGDLIILCDNLSSLQQRLPDLNIEDITNEF